MDPGRLQQAAPGARFCFIAHLPEWRLHFPIANGDGGLPSVKPQSGNTVWGAVFEVGQPDLRHLNARQAEEGRVAKTAQAMDREGHRHQVVVHVCESPNGEHRPEPGYLSLMVAGGRHWHLPAGWVASLEEHLADA
ncbi:MAG: gamma-glutamylcyclotransferase [Actinobacteria bacterium]|nr:gamma-glutamylcyclotransferase [Actinomycetota bacterium]